MRYTLSIVVVTISVHMRSALFGTPATKQITAAILCGSYWNRCVSKPGVLIMASKIFSNFFQRGIRNFGPSFTGLRSALSSELRAVAYGPTGSSEKKLCSSRYRLILPLLNLASSVHGCFSTVRQKLYQKLIFKSKVLPRPVISIGNITWGGNGRDVEEAQTSSALKC
uniref:tetraacyldisaccharide 4'-kinase n=1 Tax=Tetraselmis sp. GSL018 TaxID=582737 RepID=A0A061SI05_9CHLO